MAAWRYEYNLLVLKPSLTRSLRSLVRDIKIKSVSPQSHVISSTYHISYQIILYYILYYIVLYYYHIVIVILEKDYYCK